MSALRGTVGNCDSTSGLSGKLYSSSLVRAGALALCLVFGDLSIPATASTTYQIHIPSERTSSGPSAQSAAASADTIGSAVLEIRRRSGLTWDELATMFGVTRRSVHHWSNGKAVAAKHEHAIRQTLAAVRHLDMGASAATRAVLLTPDQSGDSYFDLLRLGRAEDVIARTGDRPVSIVRERIPLSREALEARQPPAPELLLGSIETKVDAPVKARLTRVARLPRSVG